MKVFDIFSHFSFQKLNKSKCEVTGIGILKRAKLCGMKCIDLGLSPVKILGIHFLYNKNIENDEIFLKQITSIEKVLKLWRIKKLTLEGIITVFKAVAMFKIVHLVLVTNIPTINMKELNKIQKEFIWKNKNPK